MYNSFNSAVAIMGLLLLIFLIPIPAILIDILLSVTIILTILPLYDAFSGKKLNDHLSFAKTIRSITVLNLASCIAITKNILLEGPDFDGLFIKSAASAISFFGSLSVTIFLVIFCSAIAFLYIKYTRETFIFCESALQNLLDTRHKKMLAVETDYNERAITEEEAEEIKSSIRYEIDYNSSVYEACRFLLNNEKIKLVIFIFILIVGTFIGRRLRGEETDDSFITYVSLAVSSGIFVTIPSFLLTLAIKRVNGNELIIE